MQFYVLHKKGEIMPATEQVIAVIDWEGGARGWIQEHIEEHGRRCVFFRPGDAIPEQAKMIFSLGFFYDFHQLLEPLEALPPQKRPLFVHWNTEGIPDLRFPLWVMKWGGMVRSMIGKVAKRNKSGVIKLFDRRFHRFRYLGDYFHAYRKGLLHFLFDCSTIYVEKEKRLGLPAAYVPWGTCRSDYDDLNLERDIDVFWMGKPRNKRRNELVQAIRARLERYGKKMVVVDGVEHPYVFGRQRIEYLNRSKVTLNLKPYWDDYNFIWKFHLAAGNRSLVVSEPFLPHNPEYVAGHNYVCAEVDHLVETICHYCEQEEERRAIVENAYQLVTTSMTMTESVGKIFSFIQGSLQNSTISDMS